MLGTLLALGGLGWLLGSGIKKSFKSYEAQDIAEKASKGEDGIGEICPTDTYVDGFGVKRYVINDKMYKGGAYSNVLAERILWEQNPTPIGQKAYEQAMMLANMTDNENFRQQCLVSAQWRRKWGSALTGSSPRK